MTKITPRRHAKHVVKPSSQVLDKTRKPSNGYRVLFEQVAAKKKKLRLSDVTNPVPPRGYAFLSIGHADLADYCKEISRLKDTPVSIVSAVIKNQPKAKISQHLHRIGYHFRQDIFDQGCRLLGYRLVGGKLHRDVLPNDMWGFEQITDQYGTHSDSTDGPTRPATEQEALATKLAIKELFPNIPHKDLEEIWRRAFKVGARTVGNAQNLPLPRRVQLATVAHARHQYTDYDKLLRSMEWADARAEVQGPCLAKLMEWRGEGEDDQGMEEVMREVIVIDDEDEADSGDKPSRRSRNSQSASEQSGSDLSLEITAQPAQDDDLAMGTEQQHQLPRQYAQRLGIDMPKLNTGTQPAVDQLRQSHSFPTASTFAPVVDTQRLDSSEIECVNVPVDQFGRPPMTFVRDGITYTRAFNINDTALPGQITRVVSPAIAQLATPNKSNHPIIDLTTPGRAAASTGRGQATITGHSILASQVSGPSRFPSGPAPNLPDPAFQHLQNSLTRGLEGSWLDLVKQSTENTGSSIRQTRSQSRTSHNGIAVNQPIFGRPSSLSRPVSSSSGTAFSA